MHVTSRAHTLVALLLISIPTTSFTYHNLSAQDLSIQKMSDPSNDAEPSASAMEPDTTTNTMPSQLPTNSRSLYGLLLLLYILFLVGGTVFLCYPSAGFMIRYCVLEVCMRLWALYYGESFHDGWRWWIIYMAQMVEPLAVFLLYLYGSDFQVSFTRVYLAFELLTTSDLIVAPRECPTSLSRHPNCCFLLFFSNNQPSHEVDKARLEDKSYLTSSGHCPLRGTSYRARFQVCDSFDTAKNCEKSH